MTSILPQGTALQTRCQPNPRQSLVLDADPTEPWPNSWEPEWKEWGEHVRLGGNDADEALQQLLDALLIREANRERTPIELAVNELCRGDYVGLPGIAALERLTANLTAATGDDSLHFVDACLRLAYLYRRHGGRHEDVTRTFREAFEAASAACATSDPAGKHDPVSQRLDDVLRAWWEYLEKRRDVEDLIALHDEGSSAHIESHGSLERDNLFSYAIGFQDVRCVASDMDSFGCGAEQCRV